MCGCLCVCVCVSMDCGITVQLERSVAGENLNCVSAGDWLQGPHVYALYDSYGMTAHQIEVLFVAGFGSSMVFGTIVGSFADR